MFSLGTENVKIFKRLRHDIIQNYKYDISLSETSFIDDTNKNKIQGDISKQKNQNLTEEQSIVLRHLVVC